MANNNPPGGAIYWWNPVSALRLFREAILRVPAVKHGLNGDAAMEKTHSERSKKMDISKREELFRDLWEQLREELMLLNGKSKSHVVPDAVIKQFEITPHPLDASDVYKLESTLLEYLDTSELKIRLLMFRDMLSNVLTSESFQLLSESLIKDVKVAKKEDLREEARGLACRLYRRYVLVPRVEELKASFAKNLVYWVLIINLVALGITFGYTKAIEAWVLAACAGSMGAMVSTIRRLYQFNTRHEPLLTWLNLEKGKFSIWVSPVLGAFFALILLFVFRSNLISGGLFPDFTNTAWQQLDIVKLDCKQKDGTCVDEYFELAKVVVWGFVAGWGERMVPDVLNKLANEPAAHIHSKPTT